MFCRFCGKEIPEGGRFCPCCGKEADTAAVFQAGASAEGMPAEVRINPAQNYHMAWFKFIIYFQLFANAVVMVYNVVAGIFREYPPLKKIRQNRAIFKEKRIALHFGIGKESPNIPFQEPPPLSHPA